MQDKQELEVSRCFWSFRFPSPCCYKLLIATAAKKPQSGQMLRWLKVIGPVPREADRAGPAPEKESKLSLQRACKCGAGLEPKCLGPTGWSCKIHGFVESQARGELRNHLLWPVLGLTEAKWKTPVPSCVFKWQRMTSTGKHSRIYHHS